MERVTPWTIDEFKEKLSVTSSVIFTPDQSCYLSFQTFGSTIIFIGKLNSNTMNNIYDTTKIKYCFFYYYIYYHEFEEE